MAVYLRLTPEVRLAPGGREWRLLEEEKRVATIIVATLRESTARGAQFRRRRVVASQEVIPL